MDRDLSLEDFEVGGQSVVVDADGELRAVVDGVSAGCFHDEADGRVGDVDDGGAGEKLAAHGSFEDEMGGGFEDDFGARGEFDGGDARGELEVSGGEFGAGGCGEGAFPRGVFAGDESGDDERAGELRPGKNGDEGDGRHGGDPGEGAEGGSDDFLVSVGLGGAFEGNFSEVGVGAGFDDELLAESGVAGEELVEFLDLSSGGFAGKVAMNEVVGVHFRRTRVGVLTGCRSRAFRGVARAVCRASWPICWPAWRGR